MRVTTFAMAAGMLAACGVADEPALSSTEEHLFVQSGTALWRGPGNRGNVPVPLCWEPTQTPLPSAGFAAEQAMVIAQVRSTWQAVSGIRFDLRGACPSTGSEAMVRLRVRGYTTLTESSGSAKNVGQASLMPPAVGNDTMSVAVDIPVVFNMNRLRWERIGTDARLQYVAGHEIGHVLGYTHEQERGDTPHAVACLNGGTVATGTAYTAYDPDSIMNYCQSGGNNNGRLTALDIQGTRKIYGWRDATDYDNDGRSSAVVFRTQGADAGRWYDDRGEWGVPYGEAGDVPIAGDFDNDGRSDIAVWRPSGPYAGWWFVRNSSGVPYDTRFQWGAPGDIPTTGDLNGDGRAEFIVYRPSTRTFYIREQSGATRSYGPWGETGDIPVLADYDGDGITDLALFRPTGAWAGYWFVLNSTTPGYYSQRKYGEAGDIPVVGDFDGDARSDYAVWRPSNGWWYALPANGAGDIRLQWGAAGDVPVSLDFDGDGRTEFAVWRPSTGYWHIRTATTVLAAFPHGIAGDIPLGRTIR